MDLGNRVDVSHRVFNIPYYFAHHYESELVVGVGHCPRALELLQELVYREWLPVNYIVEVRGVAVTCELCCQVRGVAGCCELLSSEGCGWLL